MTEQEYIDVRDLSNVRHAYQLLAEIVQKNQGVISGEDYLAVMQKLSDWQDALFLAVQKRRK